MSTNHPSEENVDPWQVLESFEENKVGIGGGRIGKYLSAFRTEIIEVAAQVSGKYELAGYKINSKANIAGVCFMAIKRNLRALFKTPVSKKTPARAEIPSLLVFIEFKNHLKHFEPICALLTHKKIPFKTVFLRKDIFEAHVGTIPNAVFIQDLNLRIDYLKSNLHLIRIGLWILSSRFFNFAKRGNRLRLRLELLFMNGRFLKETLLMEHALQRVLGDGKRRLAVFFKSDGHRVRSLISTCKMQGVETIAIQHGYMCVEVKNSKLPVDHYLVWSDIFCAYLKQSRAYCHCVPVGSPGFDQLFRQVKKCQARPLNKDLVNILFLPDAGNSQSPASEVLFALDLCLRFARQHPNVKLTVKPHPGDSSGMVIDGISRHGVSVILLDRFAPISFGDFDIVATTNSTSGLEAAIFSKPLLVILSRPELLMIPEYLQCRIGLHAFSEESMRLMYEEIIRDYSSFQENCRAFVERYLCNRGMAAESAAKYILDKLSVTTRSA